MDYAKTVAPTLHALQIPLVHVVEDDVSVRDSLTWLFEGEGFEVRAYESALQLLALARPPMRGVVLLDLRMPGMTGLDLLRDYVPHVVDAPVIVLTAHGDVPLAVRCLRAGAIDMLVKPVASSELTRVVRAANLRSDESLTDRMMVADLRARLESLTPRERDVLQVMVAGRTSREIGNMLDISPKTVSIHRSSILRKLMMDSAADLIRMLTLFKLV